MTEETEWDSDPLAGLGASQDELQKEVRDREMRGRRDRDSRVCMCGHTVHAHKEVEGFAYRVCRAGKVICNCTEVEPILKPQDARLFIRATEGAREKHALFIGVSRAVEKKVGIKWLTKPACVVCAADAGVFPVPFDKVGQVASRSGTHNKFMCESHYNAAVELGNVGLVFQRYNSLGY